MSRPPRHMGPRSTARFRVERCDDAGSTVRWDHEQGEIPGKMTTWDVVEVNGKDAPCAYVGNFDTRAEARREAARRNAEAEAAQGRADAELADQVYAAAARRSP